MADLVCVIEYLHGNFNVCFVAHKADDVACGVIKALENVKRDVPIVIRLTGTNEEEGQRLLEEAGIPYETSMEKAAIKAVELCNELKAEGK